MLNISCSICFSSLNYSDDISALVCGHIYHLNCIEAWLKLKHNCPICRIVCKKSSISKLFFTDSDADAYNAETEQLQCKVSRLEMDLNSLTKNIVSECLEKNALREQLRQVTASNQSLFKDLEGKKQICLQYEKLSKEKDVELNLANQRHKKLSFIDSYLNATPEVFMTMIENLVQSKDLCEIIDILKTTLLMNYKECKIAKNKIIKLQFENKMNVDNNKLLITELNQLRKSYNLMEIENKANSSEIKYLGNFVNNRFFGIKDSKENQPQTNDYNLYDVDSTLNNVELTDRWNFINPSNKVKHGDSKLKTLKAAKNVNISKPMTKIISKNKKAVVKSYFKKN